MNLIDDDDTTPLSFGSIEEDIKYWTDAFIEQKEMDKVSTKTIRSYKAALSSFKEFIKKNNDNTMSSIGVKFVNRYLIDYQALLAEKDSKISKDSLKKLVQQRNDKHLGKNDSNFLVEGKYENTLVHRLAVLKMLLSYISDSNCDEHDYTVLFRRFAKIKIQEKFQDYLSVEDMDTLIDYMKNWHVLYGSVKKYKSKEPRRIAHRDAFLLLLYLLTGARGDEIVHVKLIDIEEFELDREFYYKVRLTNTKGGKIREVAIEKDFIDYHVKYFKSALPGSNYYISSLWDDKLGYINKPVSTDTIRKLANLILKTNNINKSGLHSFRRGYATKRVAHDGVDVSVVANELGNSSDVLERFYLKHDAQSGVRKSKK